MTDDKRRRSEIPDDEKRVDDHVFNWQIGVGRVRLSHTGDGFISLEINTEPIPIEEHGQLLWTEGDLIKDDYFAEYKAQHFGQLIVGGKMRLKVNEDRILLEVDTEGFCLKGRVCELREAKEDVDAELEELEELLMRNAELEKLDRRHRLKLLPPIAEAKENA